MKKSIIITILSIFIIPLCKKKQQQQTENYQQSCSGNLIDDKYTNEMAK